MTATDGHCFGQGDFAEMMEDQSYRTSDERESETAGLLPVEQEAAAAVLTQVGSWRDDDDLPLGGAAKRRTYCKSLLSMLTKANRPDEFGRSEERADQTSYCDIAEDPDPPRVPRGRAE
jgi:hypothetical protein